MSLILVIHPSHYSLILTNKRIVGKGGNHTHTHPYTGAKEKEGEEEKKDVS